MRVHIGTAIRIGDYVYASSGDFGPAFITAVDVKTGMPGLKTGMPGLKTRPTYVVRDQRGLIPHV